MNFIFGKTYIIESILATGILYVIYLLTLRNRPMLVFNRFSLIVILLLGVLVPLFNFSLPQNSELITSSVLIDAVTVKFENTPQTSSLDLFNIRTGYFLITVIFFVIFIFKLLHIIRLVQKTKGENYTLLEGTYPHFSFFNMIFINGELIHSKSEMEIILDHEKVHANQKHSIDIMLFEVLKIIFWFNPFVWLIKGLAVENHEYLADKGMLKSSSKSTYDYIKELLETTLFSHYKISIVNNFNHSLLKKRIMMMSKQNLKMAERFIPLFIIPVCLMVVVFFAFSNNLRANDLSKEEQVSPNEILDKIQNKELQKQEIQSVEPDSLKEDVYVIVEKMPKFRDGNFNEFRKYVMEELKYPEEAKKQGISGKVYVQFVVSSNGEVKDAKVIRSVDKLLDEEALRVIKSSPEWTPGSQRGKNVAIQYTCPIVFEQK